MVTGSRDCDCVFRKAMLSQKVLDDPFCTFGVVKVDLHLFITLAIALSCRTWKRLVAGGKNFFLIYFFFFLLWLGLEGSSCKHTLDYTQHNTHTHTFYQWNSRDTEWTVKERKNPVSSEWERSAKARTERRQIRGQQTYTQHQDSSLFSRRLPSLLSHNRLHRILSFSQRFTHEWHKSMLHMLLLFLFPQNTRYKT